MREGGHGGRHGGRWRVIQNVPTSAHISGTAAEDNVCTMGVEIGMYPNKSA